MSDTPLAEIITLLRQLREELADDNDIAISAVHTDRRMADVLGDGNARRILPRDSD